MSRSMRDLYETMFDTLNDLRAGKITVDQARAIRDVGQVIVNGAKVEVEYIQANNGGETPFLESVGNDNLPDGVVSVTRHRLKG